MRESTGRAVRIEQLKKRIEVQAEVRDNVNEDKLIAEFSLDWNVSERKVKEYIKLLITSGFCERTSSGILPTNHANLQKQMDEIDDPQEKLEGGKKE